MFTSRKKETRFPESMRLPKPVYEYKTVNLTIEPDVEVIGPEGSTFRRPSLSEACNRWAEMGWRTVAVINNYHALLLERIRPMVRDTRSTSEKTGLNAWEESLKEHRKT